MAPKTPNDEYEYDDHLDLEDSELPREDVDDGDYEEQSITFEEAYASAALEPSDIPPRRRSDARRSAPPRKAKRAARAEKARETKPVRATKKRLSRREKKDIIAEAKNEAEMMTETPVVGRRLRPGQMLVYDSELDEVDYTDPKDLPEMRDYLPIRFRRYGRIGLGGGVMYALFVIAVSIVLACFAWMCAVDVLALNKEEATGTVEILPYNPGPDDPVTVTREDANGEEVEVPIKVDIDQVATALKNSGIIEYKWLFKLFAQFSHANIKIDPGTYGLKTSYDYRALVTNMQFGSENQTVVPITFPEGFSTEQIFSLLEENKVCSKADLYNAVETYEFDYDFLEGLPLGDDERLEGFLFPDTYEFFAGEPAVMAISRFLDNTETRFAKNDVEARATERGMSVRDVVIMASLIEKEAGGTEGERENMASVIYNRLNAGWELGLDSTINYIKGTSTFDLSREDLQIDSPYNTYLYTGLPPGPICNPGMASIEAVLSPASTNYWYWYSVDGVSTFFTSYDEQQAFAAAHPY